MKAQAAASKWQDEAESEASWRLNAQQQAHQWQKKAEEEEHLRQQCWNEQEASA